MNKSNSALHQAIKVTSPFKRMTFQSFINDFRKPEQDLQEDRRTFLKKIFGRSRTSEQVSKNQFEWHKIHRIWEKVGEAIQGDVELVGKTFLSFEDWINSGETYLSLCKKSHVGVLNSLEECVDFAMRHLVDQRGIKSLTREEARDFILFSDYNEIYVRSELNHVKKTFNALRPDMPMLERIVRSYSWPYLFDDGHLGRLIHLASAFPIVFSSGETSREVLGFPTEIHDMILPALICRIDHKSEQLYCCIDTRAEFDEWLARECSVYPKLEIFPIHCM